MEFRMLNEQEKLDKIVGSIFNTIKSDEEPPKPTKKDYERKFRIVFGSDDEPNFEEVEEED